MSSQIPDHQHQRTIVSNQARNYTVVMSCVTIALMIMHAITDDDRWWTGAVVALAFASIPLIAHILRSGGHG